MSTYATIYNELTDIIARHAAEISQFVPDLHFDAEMAPEALLAQVDRLVEITNMPVSSVTYEHYLEACECQDSLTGFLQVMNQTVSSDFTEATNFGRILAQTERWRRDVVREFERTTTDVWELIAPATPDHLADLGSGQYEARWWKPVPVMDIEILKFTEGVSICGEPFEPVGLSGGLALRFSIIPGSRRAPLD